ncbi:MAG: hypothetical protein AB1490_05375 [Pseudomonadota bacterium]
MKTDITIAVQVDSLLLQLVRGDPENAIAICGVLSRLGLAWCEVDLIPDDDDKESCKIIYRARPDLRDLLRDPVVTAEVMIGEQSRLFTLGDPFS